MRNMIPQPTLYPETWITLERVAELDFNELVFPHRPTISAVDFIDERHEEIAGAKTGMHQIDVCIDLGIEGYLTHGDALKLYEMAALGRGDVLELGTHKGLSTTILAEALSRRADGIIETIDIDLTTNIQARENVAARVGTDRVNFVVMDATRRLDELIKMHRRFGFVFVDHWHGYDATYEAASRLENLLLDGGFVLFHDVINPGNADPDHPYGVFQAIDDTIRKDSRFVFCGNFGCCSLYQFNGEKVLSVFAAQEEPQFKLFHFISKLKNKVFVR
ncbi:MULTISPECIES: class I SAM-dependent methyltransferase [unclassified Brucella]|uniref:O-methyltransferase n=1 Tax=unclassified Brucella TaxID=2632610 RepID=UPI0012AE1033|nr:MULTISPECIES: class I SAM-dependent methyltransferase [unclassified Brucella]MRN44867.1 hypothetical protein [Brucella sp. 09RB8913]MRN60342.1 hypothetical protein [Brucella sp. 09RB8918]CAB4326856.1 hypothetical protein BCH_02221 [Brucella sp. 191011898]